jgi:riboflavin kinase/FMN adenylyltransferase
MLHYWSLESVYQRDAWLTIGSFDGVHRGHQEIIKHMAAGAHQVNAPAVVLTFYPHPSAVLRKRSDSFYLTSPEERAELLGSLGIDLVITHPFNLEVAALSARDFMARLTEHLNIRHLFVGYDFALGRGREGDVPRLKEVGEELGYSVTVVPPYRNGDAVISSSQVRSALTEGDVARAARLLGRPYRVSGEVVRGDGRGRTIGIPTANLNVWAQRVIPGAGVYVCQAKLNGRSWGAVTNIGVRPTFNEQPVSPRVEAHLLDYDHDLYGQTIQLDFLSRIRDEQRFPSVQALVEQIRQDIQKAREYLL